jgi:hypothetical protein
MFFQPTIPLGIMGLLGQLSFFPIDIAKKWSFPAVEILIFLI